MAQNKTISMDESDFNSEGFKGVDPAFQRTRPTVAAEKPVDTEPETGDKVDESEDKAGGKPEAPKTPAVPVAPKA